MKNTRILFRGIRIKKYFLIPGESERLHYDLNRGLLAVACYYDAHRMLAEILRRILSWDREATTRTMRRFVKENFVNREVFRHLLSKFENPSETPNCKFLY